jgi:hypothetical protein
MKDVIREEKSNRHMFVCFCPINANQFGSKKRYIMQTAIDYFYQAEVAVGKTGVFKSTLLKDCSLKFAILEIGAVKFFSLYLCLLDYKIFKICFFKLTLFSNVWSSRGFNWFAYRRIVSVVEFFWHKLFPFLLHSTQPHRHDDVEERAVDLQNARA